MEGREDPALHFLFGAGVLWYPLDMDSSLKIDVSSLDAAHRQAIEDVLGLQLQTNQRLIIQVATLDSNEPLNEAPDVMNLIAHFYDGVTENEVEEIDSLLKTRANLTRALP